MFINIDPSSGLPIYIQIAQQIKTAVAMGRLHPEEPLPSVRQLAVDLAVNPNTVARALVEIEGDTTEGAGTFVSGDVEMSKAERRGYGRAMEKDWSRAHLGWKGGCARLSSAIERF